MKRFQKFFIPFMILLSFLLVSCGEEDINSQKSADNSVIEEEIDSQKPEDNSVIEEESSSIDLSEIPEYTGDAYIVINGNVPNFNDADMVTESFERYSELDSLGRCGVAYANIGVDIMPTEERGDIGGIKPAGWHTVKYDNVDGKYLYNRCHLIGYQLAAENANEKNLITGTRYLNVNGMLPFENMVADYVKETNNHVLYRVSPIFEGDNLIAAGVQMEAKSVEDEGEGILFNVFCYNVQPDINIDYATGDSSQVSLEADNEPEADNEVAAENEPITDNEVAAEIVEETPVPEPQEAVSENTYILNTNTKKFHSATCRDVGKMKDTNKQEYTGNREDIINQGYAPCKHCNP